MSFTPPSAEEINAMSPQEFKSFENKLRRIAHQKGYTMTKSRTRDPSSASYGAYFLADDRTDRLIVGDPNHGTSIHDVALALVEQ